MQIETFDGLPAQFDRIVSQSPFASFYQSRVWLEALAASFPRWSLRCITARSGEDLLGVLPYIVIKRGMLRMCWSLPMGTYGGPVVAEGCQIEERLIDRFIGTRREAGVYEVGLVDFDNQVNSSRMSCRQGVTHIIDLDPGFDHIWSKQFKASKRRNIRKAEREGVEITRATSDNDVRDFYAVCKQRTDEWKRSFIYPKSLFENLFKNGGDSVRLFLAKADDRLLGGHLNFYFGNTAIFWYGLTTRDSRSTQASTMLYSTCIRDACENGYKRYNLGGSLDKETLMEYKEALGGTAYSYRVHRWRSVSMRGASLVRRLLRRSSE